MKIYYEYPKTFTTEDMVISKKCAPSIKVITDKDYFIIGRTLNGGFYLSEDFSEEEVSSMLYDYSSVVSFFGGGTIDLCRKTVDSYETIYSKVIW